MAIKTYKKLIDATINGFNTVKSGDIRNWEKVTCTGRVRVNRKGDTMTEVIDNGIMSFDNKRWLNMSTFSGTIIIDGSIQTWQNGKKLKEQLAIELFFELSIEEMKMIHEDIKELNDLVIKEMKQSS